MATAEKGGFTPDSASAPGAHMGNYLVLWHSSAPSEGESGGCVKSKLDRKPERELQNQKQEQEHQAEQEQGHEFGG
uniref:HDC09965 n=1 Tax=Drosophila melanogaster TaxID=7227 RepID=Q6ILA2_DROME|nr:TPA_inf: HDC09965 [Drosophila melanogaster]